MFLLQLLSGRGVFMPKLALTYVIFVLTEYVLLPVLPEAADMILSMFVVNVRNFFPVLVCIVLLYKNTRVSEMSASLTQMGISRKVTVPVAVAIRYIPTLKEEWEHIRDAMRMRSITAGITNPFKRIACKFECYLVPLFVSSLKSSDELAAAAVSRGIENPAKPSCRNYRPMGMRDYVTIVLALAVTVMCFLQRYGRQI
ncbi:MAG: energy-coupling factor transporter transmembrane protein EcfT [Oscillospiraceae bacterium]|nr:energy-coupling factor transporter transmembrane protein EcfT [Oscillospiraceae bacterium]